MPGPLSCPGLWQSWRKHLRSEHIDPRMSRSMRPSETADVAFAPLSHNHHLFISTQQIRFRLEFHFLSTFNRTRTAAQPWPFQRNLVEFASTLTLFTGVTFLHCSMEVLNELRWEHWLCQGLMPSDWSKASLFTSFFKLVAKIQRRWWWFYIPNKEQTWEEKCIQMSFFQVSIYVTMTPKIFVVMKPWSGILWLKSFEDSLFH